MVEKSYLYLLNFYRGAILVTSGVLKDKDDDIKYTLYYFTN